MAEGASSGFEVYGAGRIRECTGTDLRCSYRSSSEGVWILSYDSLKDTIDHINNVRQKLYYIVQNLLDRTIRHDMSKTEQPEKAYYDEFSEKLRTLEYGSDEYKETLRQMLPGIQHHYEHNSHHPEHYPNGIDGMDLLDLIEMLADWKAAGERHKDKPTSMTRSLEINVERFGISPQLRQVLWNTLNHLEWL